MLKTFIFPRLNIWLGIYWFLFFCWLQVLWFFIILIINFLRIGLRRNHIWFDILFKLVTIIWKFLWNWGCSVQYLIYKDYFIANQLKYSKRNIEFYIILHPASFKFKVLLIYPEKYVRKKRSHLAKQQSRFSILFFSNNKLIINTRTSFSKTCFLNMNTIRIHCQCFSMSVLLVKFLKCITTYKLFSSFHKNDHFSNLTKFSASIIDQFSFTVLFFASM